MKLPKKQLDKIENDITQGLKFKSADRLRNLINEHPHNMDLWNRLAELYYQAGFLDAAGKYWIFIEPTQPHIKECVEIYEKSVNYSGTTILNDLKFRGDKSKLSSYGQAKLTQLEKNSREKSGYVPKFYPKPIENTNINEESETTIQDTMFVVGMTSILISIPIFAIIGFMSVIWWLFF